MQFLLDKLWRNRAVYMNFGILSIVPVIVVIILAVYSRKAFESILVGTLIASLIYYGPRFILGWVNTLLDVAGTADTQWILLMCGLFGSLIALITASHGTDGFKKIGEKICKTEKTTKLTAFFLGVIIFIDDYLNMITVGACMRSLFDKKKMPREQLAYIMNSTGTPVCVLLPISTWAAYYGKLFLEQDAVKQLQLHNETSLYLRLIPFAFYAIFTVIITLLFCMNIVPAIGMMKRADTFGTVKETLEDHSEGNIIDFIIPLSVLAIGTVLFGNILPALILSIGIAGLLYVPRRKIHIGDFGRLIISGFCDMVPTLAIIVMALMLAKFSEMLGMTTYIIDIVRPLLNGYSFPVITFIVVALLCFATSSTWGLSAIVIPIIIPLAAKVNANLFLVMGAILSGNAFGSHACFYSDATVLAAASAGVNNMKHALTQFPYAIIAALISIVLYIIFPLIIS